MQNVLVKAEEFVDHVKEYVNNRIAAVKLQAAESISKIVSDILAIAIVAAIMFVFILFISFAAAWALSDWMGESWSGFLVVAGLWLVTGTTIWLNKEKLLRMPIMNKMLQQLFRNEEDS